jgi:glycosyltransferase involved in cell wall biosynthesis
VTVLYFADTRFPIERANGAQTMATCRALALRGHDVRLIVRPDTASPPRDPFAYYGVSQPEQMTIDMIDHAPGPLGRVRFLAGAFRRCAARPGVILTRDLGLASWIARTPMLRPRLVYESHGLGDVVSAEMPQLLGRPSTAASAAKLRRLARREEIVWRRAAAYVTITRALADDLRQRFGVRDHVHVVPDGGPQPVHLPVPPRPRPLVAYAGHLYPWKGVDVFVEALASAPDVDGLVIGGHPAENDLQRVRLLAASHGVADRVTFTGHLPPSEVISRLSEASVLVLPNTASSISERYTSPLKLFEYLALGRAIVASDFPAIREVLTDNVTALLVPPGDARAMAEAINRIARDEALATRLADAAHALAPQYTWESRAERLESALRGAAA